MSDIDVSLVVTVYNKEQYLPATVRSLLRQQEGKALNIEYVFVDDVSKDRSIECIEALTKHTPHVVIIRNDKNAGPSVRLNQGVSAARGKYVQFLDSDDILAAGATKAMVGLLERYDADLIYGGWERTQESGEALLSNKVEEPLHYNVSDEPFTTVLNGRFVRMVQMCKRDVYLQGGGADERVFIQDESLPLRLAYAAKRFIALKNTIMYVPYVENPLSQNVAQLNHDRFFANYYMLKDQRHLTSEQRKLLFNRSVSAGWKQVRSKGLSGYCSKVFYYYLLSKLGVRVNECDILSLLEKLFADIPNVRHTEKYDVSRAA